jgi:hypothetical protein
LLHRYDFVIESVLKELDSMLTTTTAAKKNHLQPSFVQQRSTNKALTAKEKQRIYKEARRPVDVLFNEYRQLQNRLKRDDNIRGDESRTTILHRMKEVKEQLIPAERLKATNYIWEKINSAGPMGMENESGDIEIDFHALHIDEAMKKFNDQILPLLRAKCKVLLVVGRGNHSKGGVAKLKPALLQFIDHRYPHLTYQIVNGNAGMIRVQWKE